MLTSSLLLLLALSGVVRDEDGQPIEGATIVVRRSPPDWLDRFDVVETDTLGQFRLDLAGGARELSVGVFAEGFVPRQEASVDAGAELDVVLTRGSSVEGVVVDARSREPIAGASVEKRMHERAFAPPERPLLGLARTHADARGAFRLEGIAFRIGTITASAPGYGRTEAEIRGGDAPIVLALSPGRGIYGRVVAPDGEPLEGAFVGAQQRGNGRARLEPGTWTSTDVDGRFALLGVEPGAYTVVVRHPEHPFVLRAVEVGEEDVVLDDLRAAPGGGIAGALTNTQGAPVEGALIVRAIDGAPPPSTLYDLTRSRPDESSPRRLLLLGLPPGDYELSAAASGFAERRLSPFAVVSGEVTDIGEVVLGDGSFLAGLVTDRDGLPLSNATVFARREGRALWVSRDDGSHASARTTPDGTFAMAGLEPGSYRLAASAPSFSPAEDIRAEAGDTEIVIVMEPVGGIAGRVVGPDGAPVLDFRLAVVSLDRRNGGSLEIPSSPTEDGSFVFEALEPGSYRIGAVAPGFKPARLDDVVVSAGTINDVGTLVLKTGGTLRGRVFDSAGEPVVNAEVELNPGHGGRTDAEGRFDIRGLEVGVIDVRVMHSDFAQKTLKDVELRSEESPVDLRIELGRGGAVDGIVRDRDGLGLPDRRLRYRGPSARQRVEAATDLDGTFRAERLEEGLYRFELMSEGSVETAVQSVEVEVSLDEITRVELVSREILVSGQVLKQDVSVPGAHLALRPKGGGTGFGYTAGSDRDRSAGGPLPMNALTGPDGFYELYVEAPGEYEVMLNTADGATFPRKTLFVPDVTSHTANLRWGTITLEGRVVSEDSSEPVADARVRAYPMATGPVANAVGYASTDPSGAFHLELEPGEYRLTTAAEGYGTEETPVNVSEQEMRAVSVVLARGGAIRGVVLDANGNHPGRYFVHAVLDSGGSLEPPVFSDWAEVRVDGSFELEDLSPARYNILAGSDLLGFALAAGVTPGDEITLRLRPAAWVDVTVQGPDGAPLAGAQVVVSAFQGYKVRGVSGRTDVKGEAALYTPSGVIELKAVHGEDLVGALAVTARPGERVSASIRLYRSR